MPRLRNPTRARAAQAARRAIVSIGMLAVLPLPAEAQYFGRNKVRYDAFDFRVLSTPHFRVHFYSEADSAPAFEDAARMAERWYARLSGLLDHEFRSRKPLIFYADHPDFQQTNTLEGFIDEGTGGVTEGLKDRVIMPLTGSYRHTDQVLGHELVHAFQFDIARQEPGVGLPGLMNLPLWFVEGMAEYLSIGPESTLTSMWLRDAVLRGDVPTLARMTRDMRYFPYRFGHAFWAFVARRYGDEAVVKAYRRALRQGWEAGLAGVLGAPPDSLSAEWRAAVESAYGPLVEERDRPDAVGRVLVSERTGGGRLNLAPSVSPDGRWFTFLSERDVFTIDLYLADAVTGRVVRRLAGADSDGHVDALRYLDSAGSWSPDATRLVFVASAGGRHQLAIADAATGRIERRIPVPGVGAISGPAWSPDGSAIAFSGSSGGISDLYVLDLRTGEARRLTHDRYADLQPAWSPDGRTLAFASDRGPETDMDRLTYGALRLLLLDVETGAIRELPDLPAGRYSSPQFSPDGTAIYVVADPDGFSDVYRIALADGSMRRITRLATGVSGITELSPALSVARENGSLLFSVFHERGFGIHALEPDDDVARARQAAKPDDDVGPADCPLENHRPGSDRLPAMGRVAAYLADPDFGLPEPGVFAASDARAYRPRLRLDLISVDDVGVGRDAFGTVLGGGLTFWFSDMLGDHVVGTSVQLEGDLDAIGAQALYLNRERRLNWGAGAGRTPFLSGYQFSQSRPDGGFSTFLVRQRITVDEAAGLLAYPFSTTRRVEGSLGLTRYSFAQEAREYQFTPGGQLIDRVDHALEAPDGIVLAGAAVALVGDASYAGFTSPVRGTRYRFELGLTAGAVSYGSTLADYRRYLDVSPYLTIAGRGFQYGRLGDLGALERSGVDPLFLGSPNLIRGYAYDSFEPGECAGGQGCPALNRLFGHRLGVANLELRLPLTGTRQFGLIEFPYVPIELAAFTDAGLAWGRSAERPGPGLGPVLSSGVAARINLLGAIVLETYYAYPWQRPEKGGHWGIQFTPGW